jgi:hypothetical protein
MIGGKKGPKADKNEDETDKVEEMIGFERHATVMMSLSGVPTRPFYPPPSVKRMSSLRLVPVRRL